MSDTPTTATWVVELVCLCPKCAMYVNLMDYPDFWEGKSTLALAEHGTEKSNNLSVICPECGHAFNVRCEW